MKKQFVIRMQTPVHHVLAVLTAFVLILSLGATANAVVNEADTAKPVHVAVLLDCSGSVFDSPKTLRESRAQAASFVSKIPTTYPDTAVAVYGYAGEPKQICGLKQIMNLQELDAVRNSLKDMDAEDGGSTALIAAVRQACAALQKASVPDVQDAIVVFTDGEENVELTADAVEKNENSINAKVQETLRGSNAKIYCIGYDYVNNSGKHSLRDPLTNEEGYGEKLLRAFSEQSGGRYYAADTTNLERAFDEIIHDLTNQVGAPEPKPIPQKHDIPLEIPYGAAEVNIRISCSEPDAVKNGEIMLTDEQGNPVELPETALPNATVWYATDSLGANIKLLFPHEGTWTLNVSDIITEEDVFLTFDLIFNPTLQTEISYSGSDRGENVSMGDKIQVRTILVNNGDPVSDPQQYRNATTKILFWGESSAFPSSLGNMTQEERLNALSANTALKQIQLSPSGASFIATIEDTDKPGVYCVAILIGNQYYYCYEPYTVTIGDSITVLQEFDDVQLMNGQDTTLTDLKSHVSSDKVSIALNPGFEKQIAEITLAGDNLNISAKSPGKTQVTLEYTLEGSDKSVSASFNVEVLNSPPKFRDSFDPFMTVRAGAETVRTGLLSDVENIENDPIVFYVRNISDPDMVSVTTDGDKLIVKGLKHKSNPDRVTFELFAEDEFGTDMRAVTVQVKHSIAALIALIVCVCCGLLLLGLLTAIISKKTRRIAIPLYYLRVYDQRSEREYALSENEGEKLDLGALKLKSGVGLGNVLEQVYARLIDTTGKDPMPEEMKDRFSSACELANSIKLIGSHGKADHITLKSGSKTSEQIKATNGTPGGRIETVLRSKEKKPYRIAFAIPGGHEPNIVQIRFTTGSMELDHAEDMENWYQPDATSKKTMKQQQAQPEIQDEFEAADFDSSEPIQSGDSDSGTKKPEVGSSDDFDDFLF